MSDSLERRLAAVEEALAALDGAEPTTSEPGEAPVTLAQVRRETVYLWQSVRGIRDDISEIKAALAKLQK